MGSMKWLKKRKPVFARATSWQENAPAFLKSANMGTYAAPRDWDKACALHNLRVGVRLTDAQKKRFPDLARVEARLLEAKKGGQA